MKRQKREMQEDHSVIDDAKDRILWILKFPIWHARLEAVREAYPRIKDQLPDWAWAHFVHGGRPWPGPNREKSAEEQAFLDSRRKDKSR